MFRQIAASRPGTTLLDAPAGELLARLELLWAARSRGSLVRPRTGMMFDHLIYAYLIENTRVDEIVRRLIFEVTHGERLAVPQNAVTYAWLRSTEELFYSFGPPHTAMSTVSQLRSDPRKTRRNAYFRMFGMDLNHGGEDGGPFPYEKAQVANRDFVPTFETFLREVWRAIENATNTSGPNTTDSGAIANLALRLQTMLNERRGGAATDPNLAREEFSAVAAMSWLHLLLDSDNGVMQDFRTQGATPEERLARLGERVGVPSHANSHSFFILAPIMSLLLIEIESGMFSQPAGAQLLFLPTTGNPIRDDVLTIIDHWSRLTGRNLKALPVAASPAAVLPPQQQLSPIVLSANGASRVP